MAQTSQSRYESGVSSVFTGTLKDHNGVVIPLANLSTLTLRVTDAVTGNVINSRSDGSTGGQNVKNTNNVSVGTSTGAMTWNIQPGDLNVTDADASFSEHVAEIIWTYTHADFSTTQTAKHTHRLHIQNYLMLCTFEDVKQMLTSIADAQQPLVENLIEAFSARAERYSNRKFKKNTAVTEFFSPQFDTWHVRLSRYPVDSVTSVHEDILGAYSGNSNIALNNDDFDLVGNEGILKMRFRQFFNGVKSLRIIYSGGLANDVGGVPMDLRLAATRQVAYWFTRRNQIGVSEISISRGGRQSLSEPMELLPDVRAVLEDYSPRFA